MDTVDHLCMLTHEEIFRNTYTPEHYLSRRWQISDFDSIQSRTTIFDPYVSAQCPISDRFDLQGGVE